MTLDTINLEEVFRSRANFEDYMINSPMPVEICNVLAEYPRKNTTRIAELTQNFETFLNTVGKEMFDPKHYIVWIVTNEKEKIINTMRVINQSSTNGLGIFVFKVSLNENKTAFECLVKPEIKAKRTKNENTPVKILQKEYWNLYIEICDGSEYPDMQIKEAAPQHFQNVSIQKTGIQILQTVNTQNNFVASELAINNNKSIFEKLFAFKDEIEKEVGKLEWDSKENNKSAKIRKIYQIDINNPENHQQAINEHIKMGAELKAIAHKYL